jgi:hypothetical protein
MTESQNRSNTQSGSLPLRKQSKSYSEIGVEVQDSPTTKQVENPPRVPSSPRFEDSLGLVSLPQFVADE